MQILVPADASARLQPAARVYDGGPPREPYQLSFLSPLAGATAGEADNPYENGEFLPPLYARVQVDDSDVMQPADAATIIDSAEALLAWRFRRGVKILRDPYLLSRFLRIRLVSQRQPVFAAFFLDRKQRLIRFSELFRGVNDRVVIYPKEVVRDALACSAEQVLCVRSDPLGDHQPTVYDMEDARRVKHALELLHVPLVDYVIAGESVTSLLQRGVT